MLPSAYLHLPGKFICYKKSFPIIYIKFSYITLERDSNAQANGKVTLKSHFQNFSQLAKVTNMKKQSTTVQVG